MDMDADVAVAVWDSADFVPEKISAHPASPTMHPNAAIIISTVLNLCCIKSSHYIFKIFFPKMNPLIALQDFLYGHCGILTGKNTSVKPVQKLYRLFC
jgi:hypothetical protein